MCECVFVCVQKIGVKSRLNHQRDVMRLRLAKLLQLEAGQWVGGADPGEEAGIGFTLSLYLSLPEPQDSSSGAEPGSAHWSRASD